MHELSSLKLSYSLIFFSFFVKLVQQAPLLTDGPIKLIQKYCEDPRRAQSGVALVHQLIMQRPNKRLSILRVLLDLSSSKVEKVASVVNKQV